MVTIIAIMLPICLVTMAIEFCIDIPEKIQTRKEFAMYKRSHSMRVKGC